MNCRLISLIVLVLAVGSELCSAGCLSCSEKKPKPLSVYKDVSKVSIRYKPEQLFGILGFSLKQPHSEGVVDILAATSDKDKPNTIANKYSINDLLAMNEVYEKDFTPEKFNEKLALCESLSPEHVEKPASGFVLSLMNQNSYQEGERNAIMDKEDRKPHVYMYQKNLHDYCIEAFNQYHYRLRLVMKVDQELDGKVKQLEKEVDKFLLDHPRKYFTVQPGSFFRAHQVMVDFLREKQPSEVEQIKTMCSELIGKVKFVAERELHRIKEAPTRYAHVYTYCQGIFHKN